MSYCIQLCKWLVYIVVIHVSVLIAQTPMGTEIVNRAEITWQSNGVPQDVKLTPEASFIVARAKSQGVLSIWELDKGLTSGPFEEIYFPRADFRRNPFIPLPEPIDTSSLTFNNTPIDRSKPLRVFRTDRVRLGIPIFFMLTDAGLNLDPLNIETVIVILTDLVTGDSEELRFYETGPNTGAFTGWINTTSDDSSGGDGLLSTAPFSSINAQYNESSNQINNLEINVDVGSIDPHGIVFDSETGQLLSGIELTLINSTTGKPAEVFGDNMISSYPSTVISGGIVKDSSGRVYQFLPGEYRFPFVLPGKYRIEIKQSIHSTHSAPSARNDNDIQSLSNAPFSLVAGSRLDEFSIGIDETLNIDIPMDALAIAQITRTASHSELSVGEFFEYTVTVTSSESNPLRIIDFLPPDVSLIPNSLLINGNNSQFEIHEEGRRIVYVLPAIPAGQTTLITYAAQVTPPASAGKVLYSSSEISTPGTRWVKADHHLSVRDSLGIEKVALLGQINSGGCSGSNLDYDLSGIRVLLENGEYVITDSDGRFSFRDLYRRTRVVMLDETTLPDGARAVQCYASTRHAGSALSQFVDMKAAMMSRIEFYLEFDEESESHAKVEYVEPLLRQSFLSLNNEWIDEYAKNLEAGFVIPSDKYLSPSEAIDIAYIQPVGSRSTLLLNGETVSTIRKESSIRSSDGIFELIRYRAVRIVEGRNSLSLQIFNDQGKPLFEQVNEVLYGLHPSKVELIRSSSFLESDGRSHPYLKLRLFDNNDIPIRPGTQVTVMIDQPFGFVTNDNLRRSMSASERKPKQRTSATVDETGSIDLILAPVLEGGTARISIASRSGNLKKRIPISVPDRPWVLVGLAEGTIAHRHVSDHLRREGSVGSPLASRISLFTEGVIKGHWLLSLRYDSAQNRDQFYGIDPDADYIVYGDRSIQGSAAESRFPLYLRLRKESAAFLVGDFNTQINTPGLSINQKVTGAQALLEEEEWGLYAFTAQTTNRQVEDRLPLNGSVGPYQLSKMGISPYSQSVRLITVSRTDTTEELSTQALMSGVDYVINYSTGELYLRRPIPAFTVGLDRQVLVVDYEVDDDLKNAWLTGVRAEIHLTDDLKVASTHVHGTNVDGRDIDISLNSFEFEYQLTDSIRVSAEELNAQRQFPNRTLLGSRRELRADIKGDVTQASTYIKTQQGQVSLTSVENEIVTQIIGASLQHQLSMSPVDNSMGLFLEGNTKEEKNSVLSLQRSETEMLLTYDEKQTVNSLGLKRLVNANSLTTDENYRLLYRGQFISEDRRISKAFGIEYSLNSDSEIASDKIDLLLGFDVSDQWQLFNTFEVDRQHQTDLITGRTTLGMAFKPSVGRTYRSTMSWAGNRSQQGQAYFIGADHQYILNDGITASLGADAQTDVGAHEIPFGGNTGNPFITESFVALRGGLRYDQEDWGVGYDNEWRRTDTTLTSNFRLRLDGELTEQWSAGIDAVIGFTLRDKDPWRHSFKLIASAAHRASARDPITLVQAELRQRSEVDVESLTAMASVYRSEYLTSKDLINLRYGLKYDRAILKTGKVDDWLHLLGAEYRRDLTKYLDFGLHSSFMYAQRSKRTLYSQGVSLGVTPFDNGWISIGYNIKGFNDAEFSKLGYTDKGPFIQFRMKFDSTSLRGLFK